MANKFGLDLDAAWAQVLAEEHRNHDAPDILHLDDYKVRWQEERNRIEAALDADTYLPANPILLDKPKSEVSFRPICVLDPPDRVVYQAIVNEMAPHVDAELSGEVFSVRLHEGALEKGTVKVHDQIRAWRRFEHRARDLHKTHGYAFMLTTDLSSYFEHVDLGTLIKELKSLPAITNGHADLLSKFLNHIERSSHVWGLPQNIRASAILGNYYLLPADRRLRQEAEVVFIRFQDDIKAFANEKHLLRIALRNLTKTMRARRLNLAAHKTTLLEGPAIAEALENARRDTIQYSIDIEDDSATEELRSLFDDAKNIELPDERDIRFAVYRLGQRADGHAVGWIVAHLDDVPYLASLLVDYLSKFTDTDGRIEPAVREYLADPRRNIHPYVEMHLCRMLARAGSITEATMSGIWSIARDQRKHTLAREHAIRCIGRHARTGDGPLVHAEFQATVEFRIRRAYLVAFAEAQGRDPAFLGSVARDSPELEATAKYLGSITTIPAP